MNLKRLKQAEAEFLQQYPMGFSDPGMAQVIKRHRVDKMTQEAVSALSQKAFGKQAAALDAIVRVVTRSSMISLFEKPKFRDYVNGLSRGGRSELAAGFRQLLHGDPEPGFEQVVDVLADGRLAKWSVLTICPFYVRPEQEVFVKPTTTKNAISFFALEGLDYRPRPSWDFYRRYRAAIDQMKANVDPCLSPNNAAFTGFLMASMGGTTQASR